MCQYDLRLLIPIGPWFGEYQPRSLETLVFFTKRGNFIKRRGENKVSSGFLLKKNPPSNFWGWICWEVTTVSTQMEGSNFMGLGYTPHFGLGIKKNRYKIEDIDIFHKNREISILTMKKKTGNKHHPVNWVSAAILEATGRLSHTTG